MNKLNPEILVLCKNGSLWCGQMIVQAKEEREDRTVALSNAFEIEDSNICRIRIANGDETPEQTSDRRHVVILLDILEIHPLTNEAIENLFPPTPESPN